MASAQFSSSSSVTTEATSSLEPSLKVQSRAYSLSMAGVFVFMALIESTFFFQHGGHDRVGSAAFSAVIELALCVVIVRTWRGSTVLTDHSGVVARSILRTRRWQWEQVREFVAATRPNGMMGYRRRMLGIALVDGTTHWCTDINCGPGRGDKTTWIDGAVVRLNDHRRALA